MTLSGQPDGVLVIDKPVGPTSHDIVARVRRHLGCRTGHTGTLDPGASGVLPLVIGRATRLAALLQSSEKAYRVTLQLGLSTDTYDWQGRETERRPVPTLDDTRIEAALQRFRGSTSQTVPPFSAVRVAGERLYKAARRGESRPLPIRTVEVSELTLVEKTQDRWTLTVTCGPGTYIRSLVHDLGEVLECGATVTALRRERVGAFTLARAISLETLEKDLEESLLPMETLLGELPRLDLEPGDTGRVAHGNSVAAACEPGRIRLFADGLLVAIGEADGTIVKPKIVLRAAD